ncbi:acyl-CoA carboxylase subunit beta [Candidatus Babeliales bacterium]|nr:acyl-CoA carboxylase subunit beta [Candidatus Babeliales bacterium]
MSTSIEQSRIKQSRIEQSWQSKQAQANKGGPQANIDRHTKSGKKTARERISLLLDERSFEETDQLVTSPLLEKKFYTDGVVTGFGTVNGRRVALFSQDFTIKGGSFGKHHAQKICKIMDLAAKIGCPIIGIIDSGGARVDEGILALGGCSEIFMRNTRYSGVVPQLSIVLGPCAGAAAYSPALTDFIFTAEGLGQLFITGPQVIKQALHQEITKEELGGASAHAEKSGVIHFVAQTEEECFEQVKDVLSYLPGNYLDKQRTKESFQTEAQKQKNQETFLPAKQSNTNSLASNSPRSLIPKENQKAYDIVRVINSIVDEESFFEVQERYAKNIVIGFARMQGRSVGIVANQPLHLAGALDINASCKAARFINFCDNFSIPLISLVDIPGFMPGVDQEHGGIIKHGAKLLSAYAQATIPKITVILRKAFGGAYIVMGSKNLGADLVYAWPTAQIAVLGTQAGVTILHGRKLRGIENEEERDGLRKQLESDYEEEFLNPFIAAEFGYVDAIIEPNKTRNHLIRALESTLEKVELLPRKKHGNVP